MLATEPRKAAPPFQGPAPVSTGVFQGTFSLGSQNKAPSSLSLAAPSTLATSTFTSKAPLSFGTGLSSGGATTQAGVAFNPSNASGGMFMDMYAKKEEKSHQQ